MVINKIPIIKFSKEGYEKLSINLIKLEQQREKAIESLQKAREQGDLSENGAYKAARYELGNVDRQLRLVKYQLRFGKVIEKTTNDKIDFGSTITIDNGNKKMIFTLVGGYESDPKQNKLSTYSPIGKAVIGKKVGETVLVQTPSGERKFTIISVK
ncbi:hypothetical protein COX08_03595 [Candidatus Beckwithbacteria bacterium CG23_combo_of_CG06-09_8_20_14_all_34_8]|uniref:Transcription elongation factor GreA n=1 Tax=Candidatus Beckwithbacteria bacterium CG23_combo_of_CG06-09_8_20_14_all_34_8 TaxID=1974497 RepID=A0A2H0B5N4_9BACT|nr:MAG: hypothetical protein COX08_03595 [Candidatus Beckwithbacteria bacterium CG23_combo_of_CG06-09_8_20_14_all_34_8]